MKFEVNGKEINIPLSLSYDQVVGLSGKELGDTSSDVLCLWEGRSIPLLPGESLIVEGGMRFVVTEEQEPLCFL